jgi:hypothetical protein
LMCLQPMNSLLKLSARYFKCWVLLLYKEVWIFGGILLDWAMIIAIPVSTRACWVGVPLTGCVTGLRKPYWERPPTSSPATSSLRSSKISG